MRAAILALLAEDGSELTAAEIQDRLPAGPTLGAVKYHLRVLGDTDLVLEEDGTYRLA